MGYMDDLHAAEFAEMQAAPNERNLLIVPIEKRAETGPILSAFPGYPVLYVSKLGAVPEAVRSEILRRNHPNLWLLGGTDAISEWVAYSLSTLTNGAVYRLVRER